MTSHQITSDREKFGLVYKKNEGTSRNVQFDFLMQF